MIKKHPNNPVIKPADVKPSMEGYRVLGAFNPGATIYNDEVVNPIPIFWNSKKMTPMLY